MRGDVIESFFPDLVSATLRQAGPFSVFPRTGIFRVVVGVAFTADPFSDRGDP
jgi:hypothetical protein